MHIDRLTQSVNYNANIYLSEKIMWDIDRVQMKKIGMVWRGGSW